MEFDNPNSAADPTATSEDYTESANRITGITVDAGDVEVEQNAFFVDPSGVVYNSSTYAPVSGAVVTLYYQATLGSAASVVPNSWLNGTLGDLNGVTTGADGVYSYFFDPATAQDGIYTLEVSRAGYRFMSQSIAPTTGPFDPGLGGGAVAISADTVPSSGMDTTYYLSFQMVFTASPSTTSNGVESNHIPLDPDLVTEIEDDLLTILKEDLAATMTQQSRQMNSYAAGALQRLKSRSQSQCLVELADALKKRPVLFDTAKSTVRPESAAVLDELADILTTCDEEAFEIAGHTDDRASDAYNLALSQARVDAVAAALRQRGIDTDRLVGKGYGEARPIADNATDEGRAANRRVEFLPLERSSEAEACVEADRFDRSFNIFANDSGVSVDGSFDRETRNCQNDSWLIVSGKASYLKNDQGMSQGMVNLSARYERLMTEDSIYGGFIGGYRTKNAVTGLAKGEINGFGFNAGIYGANRFADGLFLDHYLGGAIGRHAFGPRF